MNFIKTLFFLSIITIPVLGFAVEKLNWVDLPPDTLKEILHEYDERLDGLNELIQEYHRINKTNWNDIDRRVAMLCEICVYSDDLKSKIKNEYLVAILAKYVTLSREKSSYLQKLKELKTSSYQKFKKSIFDTCAILPSYMPLMLNNERKLEYKTQEFWGQYLVEAIDPCHRRQLLSYYEVWIRGHRECDLLDFFIWLEDQNVSIFLPCINVLSKEELKKHEILIEDGKLYSSDKKLLTTDADDVMLFGAEVNFNREPIFIIDANENMFLMYGDGNNAHITLSGYLPIIGSGKMYLEEGVVKKISFESGHYLPRMEHFIQVIQYLEKKMVQLDDKIEIIYYIGYRKHQTTLLEFKEKYMRKSHYDLRNFMLAAQQTVLHQDQLLYADDQMHLLLEYYLPERENFTVIAPATAIFENPVLLREAVINALQAAFVGNVVVMPIHLHGNHWVGAVFWRQDDGTIRVVYNDPMGNPMEEERNVMVLTGTIQTIAADLTPGLEPDIIDLQLRQQHNAVDCGPFTVDNLVRIARRVAQLRGLDRDEIIRITGLQQPADGNAAVIRAEHYVATNTYLTLPVDTSLFAAIREARIQLSTIPVWSVNYGHAETPPVEVYRAAGPRSIFWLP